MEELFIKISYSSVIKLKFDYIFRISCSNYEMEFKWASLW